MTRRHSLIIGALTLATWLILSSIGDTAPQLCWTHDGLDVTYFGLVVDSGARSSLGLPTPTNGEYCTALPSLSAGSHTLTLSACNNSGCTNAAVIYVVKL